MEKITEKELIEGTKEPLCNCGSWRMNSFVGKLVWYCNVKNCYLVKHQGKIKMFQSPNVVFEFDRNSNFEQND